MNTDGVAFTQGRTVQQLNGFNKNAALDFYTLNYDSIGHILQCWYTFETLSGVMPLVWNLSLEFWSILQTGMLLKNFK